MNTSKRPHRLLKNWLVKAALNGFQGAKSLPPQKPVVQVVQVMIRNHIFLCIRSKNSALIRNHIPRFIFRMVFTSLPPYFQKNVSEILKGKYLNNHNLHKVQILNEH
jgi:hypothetical protein